MSKNITDTSKKLHQNQDKEVLAENKGEGEWEIEFEDLFNKDKISPKMIQFARHYMENNMGVDLGEDSQMEFSTIRSTTFGYLVGHIIVEYERFIERSQP